ncbi:MAG: hypothetical protein ABIS50_14540 [Luteolibacter sp.]|uniref:hypothetical protein n=1 Tax=Luteolibacter sp. TaxID=1962973 RepID=UPI0032666914
MNALVQFLAVSSITPVLLTGANYLGSSSPVAVATPSEVVFGSHVRSKVVQYFDTLEGDRPGGALDSGEVEMAPGKVLAESERESLTDVPQELARVLPASQQQVGYHIAGSYLIAVDSRYKIVDSILIPAVHRTSAGDREMVHWMTRYAGVRR